MFYMDQCLGHKGSFPGLDTFHRLCIDIYSALEQRVSVHISPFRGYKKLESPWGHIASLIFAAELIDFSGVFCLKIDGTKLASGAS